MFGNNDADSKQHKKRKRNNNPLSKARGKRTNENIWFRRSKAGFSLFVQYYMSQPVGTISNTIERKRSTIDISLPVATIAKNSKIKGEGMSRAAKRRKKKNKKRQNTRYVPESDYEPDQAINDVNSCITLERQKINALPYLVAEYSKLVNTSGSTNNMNVEFEAFLRTMSRPLPLSFRLRKLPKNSDFEDAIDRLDGKDFSKLVEAISFGNTTLYRAQSNDNKFQLCKENLNLISPALKEFLVDTSQLGMIARQEIGSMLPVLALHGVGSLQVGRRVLDMCASPGSKTLQALEIVGQKGRIVANDVSEARLLSLREALERSGVSPELLKRVHFSCQDGSKLEPPIFRSRIKKEKKQRLEFNAIICDVPCSGDGTCRKDKHILPMWKPNYGNDLHRLQLRILMRALKLVKVGGVVCYSTCTLNPIEDEAVVAAALATIQSKKRNETAKEKEGIVELVDWPNLPGDLIRRPGISSWKVAEYRDNNTSTNDDGADDDLEEIPRLHWYDSYDAVVTENGKKNSSLVSTMWPPSFEKAEALHLERCIRLWPQDRDTGGFFLALIRKNADYE